MSEKRFTHQQLKVTANTLKKLRRIMNKEKIFKQSQILSNAIKLVEFFDDNKIQL